MQTAMKTMMNQMNTQNSQFNNSGFPSGSPFPFPFPPQTSPASSPFQSQSQSSGATVDVTATKVETPPSTKPKPTPAKDIEVDKPSVVLEASKEKKEEKNYGRFFFCFRNQRLFICILNFDFLPFSFSKLLTWKLIYFWMQPLKTFHPRKPQKKAHLATMQKSLKLIPPKKLACLRM